MVSFYVKDEHRARPADVKLAPLPQGCRYSVERLVYGLVSFRQADGSGAALVVETSERRPTRQLAGSAHAQRRRVRVRPREHVVAERDLDLEVVDAG